MSIRNIIVSLRNTTGSPITLGTLSISGGNSVIIWDTVNYTNISDNFEQVLVGIATFNQGIGSGELVLVLNSADQTSDNAFIQFHELQVAFQTTPGDVFTIIRLEHESAVGLADLMLTDGTQGMTGNLNMDGYSVTNVNLVDGVDVTDHKARHISGGADQIDGYQIALSYTPTNYTAPISNVLGQHISRIDAKLTSVAGGDVVGPGSATDNAVVRFDGTTGKLVQNSAVTITDSGKISGVTDPSSAQDVATKSYVDGYIGAITFPTDAVVSVGEDPRGIAWDGADHIYVSNYGAGTVSRILISTFTVDATITVGSLPRGIAWDHGLYMYVCNSNSGTVSRIEIATGTVYDAISIGIDTFPHGVCWGGDGYMYVTQWGESKVSKILISTGVVAQTINVGSYPAGIAVDGGSYLYVANFGDGTVTRIDIPTGDVYDTIVVGDYTSGTSAVAWDSDGYMYVTNSTSSVNNNTLSTVSIIDVATGAVVSTILVDRYPTNVTYDGGLYMWFSCTDTNSMVRVSVATHEIDGRVPINVPDGSTLAGLYGTDTYIYVSSLSNIVHRFVILRGPTGSASLYANSPNRAECDTVAQSPITLSGHQSINGVTTTDGMRVLVTAQAAGANNGIYLANSSTWTRAPDLSTSAQANIGVVVYIHNGARSRSTWTLTNNTTITLGVTALTFEEGSTIFGTSVATAIGTAATGGAPTVSRSDHVHNLTFATLNTVLATANASISVNGQKITGVATPTIATDAATKGYVDGYFATNLSSTTPADVGTVGAPGTAITVSRADHVHNTPFSAVSAALAAASGTVNFNNQRLGQVASPNVANDAVNANYFWNSGRAKYEVELVSTSNIASLSGTSTVIDGVTADYPNRVLLVGQSTATQNGLYLVDSGAWTRTFDMTTGSTAAGALFFIRSGTLHSSTLWVCTNGYTTGIVDTNNLTFVKLADSVPTLPYKRTAYVAATTNVTSLSGSQTIDGWSVNTGKRVLLTAQSTQSQNGLWIVESGAWTRPIDFPVGGPASGAFVYVVGGNTNYRTSWICDVQSGSDVIGTNNLLFMIQPHSRNTWQSGGNYFGANSLLGTADGYTLTLITNGISRITLTNTAVVVNNLPIQGVANPTNAQDVATKNYVDGYFVTHLSATAPEDVTKSAAVVGVSTFAARADHKHDVPTAVAANLNPGAASIEGTATSLSRSDHRHWTPPWGTGTFTNCEGNDARLTNDRTASGIRTATTIVSVSGATAPTAGQVLKATSSTNATWQTSSGGDFTNGGDTAGANRTLGNNDAYSLSFETNNIARMTIDSDGYVLVPSKLTSYSYILGSGPDLSLLPVAGGQ